MKGVKHDKYLAGFITLFLKPLLRSKPPQIDTLDFIHQVVFLANERSIDQYTVKQPFEIPGRLRLTPTSAVQGIGYRAMKVNSPVWVRTDTKYPDVIEVETLNGPGHREQIYLLDAAEWNVIKPKLVLKGLS